MAKMCRDVAQQGENKGRSKELTEQANSPDFSFFPEFFLEFFQKALVGNKLFYFFTIFYILFSEQGSQKMQPQKLAPTTEVGCGLQKFNTFSEKRAKTLTIFFLYFPEFFWQF